MVLLGVPIHLNDPAVQSALIGAIGAVATSLIAATCAAFVSIHLMERRRTLQKLLIAQKDIEFLLSVEQLHCGIHQAAGQPSQKIIVRNQARQAGHTWSGKFTPGRIAHGRSLSSDLQLNQV